MRSWKLWKEVDGIKTYYFYADEGLVAEYDDSGNETRAYSYQPDSTWTTDPLWLKEGGEYYWYQNDHLGTPQTLIDINDIVVWSATYTAFGKAEIQTNTITNNLRFPGQYFDAETGLHYNYHRFYDPETGRYWRIDPIGFDGGDVNLYVYVGNNAINVTDPTGEAAAQAVLGYIGNDVLVPEPSDAAWLKWAGYGLLLAGAVAADAIVWDDEDDAYPFCDTDTITRNRSCKDTFPGYWICQLLQLNYPGYTYPSAQAALNVLKAETGIKNLRITSRRTATGGPCPGQGWHFGVKGGKPPYKASLVGCPCCQETPAGPRLTELWRILRKY